MACVPNYLEVARLLQGRLRDLTAGNESSTKWRELLETAAEEFGVRSLDKLVHSRKRSKVTALRELEAVSSERDVKEEQSRCRHLCCEHTELMDPNRWGALPHDLLQLVFAHLPVNKILDLQCLSRDWQKTMGASGVDSHFLRACDEAHPKMFALVRKRKKRQGPGNVLVVRVFDTKSNTWLALQTCSGFPEDRCGIGNLCPRWSPRWRELTCEDGGLMLLCLQADRVSTGKELHNCCLLCTVVNPLTRYVHDLPPIVDVQNVRMQHIMVDRENNCYKVLVVVNRRGTATEDTQVFDSETGEWSQPNKSTDFMFGNQSAHDFAKGRLIEKYGSLRSPWKEEMVQSHSFLKNRLFLLLKDTNGPANEIIPTNQPRYFIREYVIEYHPQHSPTCLEVDIHRCVPFECTPRSDYKMVLLSSNGFLMVFAALNELEPWQSDRGWLYELSTRTWRDLPKLPGNMPLWMDSDIPCEIRWNARP